MKNYEQTLFYCNHEHTLFYKKNNYILDINSIQLQTMRNVTFFDLICWGNIIQKSKINYILIF